MKKISTLFVVLFFVVDSFAQNVGINTSNPTSSLDIDGGLRLRSETTGVSSTGVTLPNNRDHHILTGSPTGNFTITISGTTQDGQHIIITNTNIFNGILGGQIVKAGVTTELIYSDGGWKTIGSSEAVSSSVWSLLGNNGITYNNFIGTINDVPLLFKTNNSEAGGIGKWGNVSFGGARSNNFFNQFYAGSTQNTAIGNAALRNNTAMNANTAVGFASSENNETGGANTAIGHNALNANKNGGYAVAIGKDALLKDTAAEQTVAVGANALYWNNNKFGNTAIGTNSLFNNSNPDGGVTTSTQGIQNTAIGHSALFNNRSGSGAIAIGYMAAYADTKTEGIIAIGRGALYSNNNRSGNIAIGDSSLFNNSLTAIFSTQGTKNTAVGDHTLFGNATGSYNTAIGSYALTSNTKGGSNTAMGIDALRNNLTGNNNTGLGENALQLNINGHRNTAIGSTAMQYRTTGDDNVAIGWGALLLDDNAKQNTAIGNGALLNQTSGIENVAIGFSAGMGNQTGNFNVFIGGHSGAFSNNTSNRLYISNSANDDSTTSLIYGNFESDSLLLNAKTIIKNNAVVRGYTKLGGYGTDVPSIKMKKLTKLNGGAGAVTDIDHGLTQSKILSVSIFINATTGNDIAPRSTYGGFEYDYYVSSNKIYIRNISGNDGNIINRPIRVLVTYEE